MSRATGLAVFLAAAVIGFLLVRHMSPHALGWLWLGAGGLLAWQGVAALRGQG